MSPRNIAHPKRQSASLLDEVLERRMLLYVLAAGATLAGSSVANAKVVFTPSNARIESERGCNSFLSIDLNNDGVTDLLGGGCITSYTNSPFVYLTYTFGASGAQPGNLIADHAGHQAAFKKGAKIRSENSFTDVGNMAKIDGRFGTRSGSFLNVTDRFLGVKFLISGQVHYGWVGFKKVGQRGPFSGLLGANLGGWAYETEANTPIIAGDTGEDPESTMLFSGEPTSLQLLAMGHTGIANRQRRVAA
jgi:hypothetical protein